MDNEAKDGPLQRIWWSLGPGISIILIIIVIASAMIMNQPPVVVQNVMRVSPEITCSPTLIYHQKLIIRTVPSVLVSYRTVREIPSNIIFFVEEVPRYAVVAEPMIMERDISWTMSSLPPPGKYRLLVAYSTFSSRPAILSIDFEVPTGCQR